MILSPTVSNVLIPWIPLPVVLVERSPALWLMARGANLAMPQDR